MNLSDAVKTLAVVYRPFSDLKPAARNPRTHSATQIEQIVRSMQQFGWTNPILVDEHNAIIAGHGRLEAARKLDMAEVPTIPLAGLTDAQKRALVIADNQLALNAGWDAEMLAAELASLKDDGFDLPVIGFSDAELDDMLIIPDFEPVGADAQGRLDERAPVTCPECGHVFSPA